LASTARSFWDDVDPEQLAADLDAAKSGAGPEIPPSGPARFPHRVLRLALRMYILMFLLPGFLLFAWGCVSMCLGADAPPAPVAMQGTAQGDPATIDKDGYVYHEVVHFQGDPKVLDYNIRATAKNIGPGMLTWAERLPDGTTDVHLVAKTGPDDTGATWYTIRHEWYQCRQWGGPYTEMTDLDIVPLATVKLPREFMYRAGSSKAR
jgi:hypothetical protein